jgi:hypothetical protein
MAMQPRSAEYRIMAAIIVALVAVLLSSASSCKRYQEFRIEEAPPDFRFLMFPSDPVVVYRTPEVKAGQEVGEVDRALTASSSEIRDGIVRVPLSETSAGYVRADEFAFLPQTHGAAQIDSWDQALRWRGYTGGEWNARPVGDGWYRVRLRLADDVHARSDAFEYLTDGRTVERVLAPTHASALGVAAVLIPGLGACIALALVLWLVRWLRRQRLPVVGPW